MIAPLAGIAVLTCATLANASADLVVFPFLAIRIAPFCYGATVLFVVPILASWPPSRHPSYPIAAYLGHRVSGRLARDARGARLWRNTCSAVGSVVGGLE